MRGVFPAIFLLCAACALLLSSCVESAGTGFSGASGAASGSGEVQVARYSKHDVALRFLTAYIRLDRRLALQYAKPEAVAKLNWSRSHQGDVPYYDDKMILYFRDGWARVYFQEVNGSYLISDLDVHPRRR